jgi:hypothetical protein
MSTREQVIQLAREAGFATGYMSDSNGAPAFPFIVPHGNGCIVELEKFATLVAKAEQQTIANQPSTSSHDSWLVSELINDKEFAYQYVHETHGQHRGILLSPEQLGALREVIRISDRDHIAWTTIKSALEVSERAKEDGVSVYTAPPLARNDAATLRVMLSTVVRACDEKIKSITQQPDEAQERAKFERWATRQGLTLDYINGTNPKEYASGLECMAFAAWQAGRAALREGK